MLSRMLAYAFAIALLPGGVAMADTAVTVTISNFDYGMLFGYAA